MNDLRFACRQLLKNPTFTAIAVLTLALGIGTCTLVFSWIRSVLMDTVPGARAPGQLVVLVSRHVSGTLGDTLSRLDQIDLSAATKVFSGVIGSQMEATSLRIGKDMEWVWAQSATANFFDVLGVQPVLGRGFRTDEDRAPRGNAVVVISHGLWQRRFAGDPAVIGRTVEIAQRQFTIIGVAPASFRGTMGGLGFDLWVPVTMSNEYSDIDRALQERGSRWLHTLGRLRDGVTLPQAQAAVDTLMRQSESAYPASNRNMGIAVLPVWKSPWGAQSRLLPLLMALAGVAALLLLLVIANVANLLLARSTARDTEMAVRLAMGARPKRLIRQTLIESLLLAALGGGLGCALATTLSRTLLWFLPTTYLPIAIQFPLDGRVLAFTGLTTIGTGLLFGLVPAWRATRTALAETLRAGGRSGGGSHQSQRLRQGLAVAEIAAALVLLVGMTLCARSFQRARQVYVGFEPRNVWLAGFRLTPGVYSVKDANLFYHRLRGELARIPGVQSVALADWLPLGFEGGSSTRFGVPGYDAAPGENIEAKVSLVSPDYFSTLKIPVLRGREFDGRDVPQSARVAIINDQLAKRFFPDRDPLGLKLDVWGEPRWIIGIVRTGKYRSLNEPPQPYLYLPSEQLGDHGLTAILRTAGAPASIAGAVERTAVALDPNAKPTAAMAMTQFMAAAYLIPRTAAILLGVLGAIAVLLAALGIYGVIAWSVGRRVREIGIRIALGAGRGQVGWLFLMQGLKLAVLGMGLGVIIAFLAGRAISSLLVDVSIGDPLTYIVAFVSLTGVIFLSSWVPARRAAHADPVECLRTE